MATPARSTIVALFGFALLTVCGTWPLARHMGSALPGNLGDPLLNAWILGWDADRLRHGLAGVWNAPILYPNTLTLAFSEHLLGIAIPLAPVVWLTQNPILAYNVAFVLTYVLAAAGMFLLAREITGRADAAVLAALAFAFGPTRTDQIPHLQVLASGWMPICLWALHRYFKTFSRRALAVFAIAFVSQALSNGYFLYFLSLPVAVVMAFEGIARREAVKSRFRLTVIELSAAGAAILLALAPVINVYLDVREKYGLRRSYGDLVNFGATVESYFHVADPVRLWSERLATSLAPERQLFPGLVVLVLATVAVASAIAGSERQDPAYRPRSPVPDPRSAVGTRKYVWCYLTIAVLAFLLSLGAEPSAWGHRVLPFSPYLWLTQIIPGFDGLRAPARFSVVVQLGLSVLAAFGAARLLDPIRKGAGPLFLVLGIAIVAEGWSAPMTLAPFDAHGRETDRHLYEWLAGRPHGGVLELPIEAWDIAPTLTYQYATLFHKHQIVNGYSGSGSTLQGWLGGRATPLDEIAQIDATVDALQSTGIKFIVVHRDDYGSDQGLADEIIGGLGALGAQIAEVRYFGHAAVFELSGRRKFASPPLAGVPIPPSRIRATASDVNGQLFAAFDGDRDSRWSTEHSQRGSEWIRIEFDRPTEIDGVRLLLSENSLGDYPRWLVVESTDEAGIVSPLRSGPVLAELAKGLLADGGYPWIDVSAPTPSPATAILLRQTGTAPNWYWSIHEIQVIAR